MWYLLTITKIFILLIYPFIISFNIFNIFLAKLIISKFHFMNYFLQSFICFSRISNNRN